MTKAITQPLFFISFLFFCTFFHAQKPKDVRIEIEDYFIDEGYLELDLKVINSGKKTISLLGSSNKNSSSYLFLRINLEPAVMIETIEEIESIEEINPTILKIPPKTSKSIFMKYYISDYISELEEDSFKLSVNYRFAKEDVIEYKQLFKESSIKLKSVSKVHFSSNQIEIKDPSFYRNKIHTSLKEALAEKDKVTFLSLNNLNLKEIPEEIKVFKRLRGLNLRENNIKEIPEFVLNLKKLTSLDLSGNNIKTIPENIDKLDRLGYLILADNGIKEIPASIGKLSELTVLHLQSNGIKKLPNSIKNLKKLEELRLKLNQIGELPAEITNLTKLKTLDLTSNKLTSLPNNIGELQWSLTDLRLANNQIARLPASFSDLRFLGVLSLHKNPLKELPDRIEEFRSLILISVSKKNLSKASQEKLLLLPKRCRVSNYDEYEKR
jgi:Leucine-rich repeat (LRR) protein